MFYARFKGLLVRLAAALLIFSICVSLLGGASVINAEESFDGLSGFNPEITVGGRTLYVDPFSGNFAVYDKNTDNVWYSTPYGIDDVDMKNSKKNLARSALILTVLDNLADEGTNTVSSQSGSVRDHEPQITTKNNTVRIVYVFDEYGFTVPLEITLTDFGFSACVDTSGIKEENEQYSLIGISLLPYFNAGYFEEDGFMLVPDGSGAVIEFNNGRGDYSEYSQSVYGRDYAISLLYDEASDTQICMPFFGIAKEKQYSMGFITGGASLASVKATGNVSNNLYNYCYSYFLLRSMDYYRNEGKWQDVEVYQKGKLPEVELKTDYILGENETPDYSVMASRLREYITDEYSFSKRAAAPSLQLDIVGATVKKRMILGLPVNTVQKLTEFDEALDMLKTLYDDGIGETTVIYDKWSRNTANMKMSTSASLSLLGGKRAFNKLKDAIDKENGNLYLAVSPFYVKSGKGIFSAFSNFAHDIFNSSVEIYPYKLNTYAQNTDQKAVYPVKNSLLGEQIKAWDKELSELKIDGILFSGTVMLHSDFRKTNTSRFDFESAVSKALSATENSVVNGGGSFYAALSSEYISGLPMSSCGFDIEDSSVPFVHMVLHGLIGYSGDVINAQSNFVDAYLRSVETGSALRFVFTAAKNSELKNSDDSALIYSSFSHWQNDLVEMYTQYNGFYESIREAAVVSHTSPAQNVYITEYDNGYYSVVNYGDTEVSGDFGTVAAKSFITGKSK